MWPEEANVGTPTTDKVALWAADARNQAVITGRTTSRKLGDLALLAS
jgi:hypothetical protein